MGVFTALAPTIASAQDAAIESELPEVVVEGAVLEAQKPKRAAAKPAQATNDDTSAPKVKLKKTASQSSGGSGSVEAPAGVPDVVEPEASPGDAEGFGAEQAAQVDGLPASRLGTSTSVVTNADLRARQITNGADALRSLPGVSVSRTGGPGGLTAVRIRGAETNHTLVVIDGVELNSGSDATFDFANLPVEDIEQIEVLRGPQSGLYGSGAVGGVINIVTKSGKGPLTVRASGEAGSFNSKGGSLYVGGGNDRIHGAVTIQGRETDGFNVSETGDERDGSALAGFTFRGGAQVFENFKIDATLRRTHLEGDRDNGFGDFSGAFVKPADDLSTFANDIWLGRVEGTLDTLGGTWVHKVRFAGSDNLSEDTDDTFGSFTRTWSQTYKYGYTSTYRLDSSPAVRHFITGLVEQEKEAFEQPLTANGRKDRDRVSFAGEVRGEYFGVIDLLGTVRHDNNDDSFDDETTWRTAASLRVPQTPFRIHGSAGTAVKYPSFAEQFGFFFGFVPNPDLVAETSFGWDAGIETTLLGGKAIIDITYFDQDLANEIDFRTLPFFNFQPFNRAGESTREGVEVAARVLVVPGVTVGGAYTYLNANNDDGSEEIRRAKHSGRADLDIAFAGGQGKFNLAAIYNGRMLDIAFDTATFAEARASLDDYWLVTASASYKVARGVEVYGRVENLLDDNYQEIFGYQTAGVAAYAGLRLTYEDGAAFISSTAP